MSLSVFGDEGDVPENNKDTAIYQELLALRKAVVTWRLSNKNDFDNHQTNKADNIVIAMDELLDELAGE